jgi:hypothetical protein
VFERVIVYSAVVFCDRVNITVVLIFGFVCFTFQGRSQKYYLIELVVDDDSQVRCKICDKRFSISHRGENDITRHVAGPIHKMNVCGKIPIN